MGRSDGYLPCHTRVRFRFILLTYASCRSTAVVGQFDDVRQTVGKFFAQVSSGFLQCRGIIGLLEVAYRGHSLTDFLREVGHVPEHVQVEFLLTVEEFVDSLQSVDGESAVVKQLAHSC